MENQPKVTRRSFLSTITMSWATFTSLPFIYGIIKYIYPPAIREKASESIIAGKTQDIAMHSAKIVRFNKRPVIVVHTSQGQYKAFSASCTHLGCVVEYRGEGRQFHCNCHGSIFDMNGKNIKGPASIPLQPFKVTLEDVNIVVTSLPL